MTSNSFALLEHDHVLLSHPELIKQYGRLKAQFLCQLHYWEKKGQGVLHQGRRWVYNTADQWAEQLHVSAGHFKRIIKELSHDGVIFIDKLSTHKSNRTNYYAINHEALLGKCQASDEGRKNFGESEAHNLQPSSEHNDTMVIQRLTNKDFNKSRGHAACGDASPNIFNSMEEISSQGDLASIPHTTTEPPAKLSPTLVRDMIQVWTDEVLTQKGGEPIKLNREISKYLVACFKHKFSGDLDAWQHYCRLLASSPYLMGKDFVLSLNWALKFSTIDRILAGELGVKKIERFRTDEEGLAEAFRHVDGVGEPERCKAVRRTILGAIGACQYNAWFTKVDVLDDGATIKPHNKFIEAAIQARFGHVLERVGR